MPDNEMIERVCAAIFNDNAGACACLGPLPWCRCRKNKAIEIIKAMREPTEKMIAAMNFVHRKDAIVVWQTVIDAVIND